jgi:2-keto-4-pentenoate hydratase
MGFLLEGDIVLSGALGPMARVEQPGRYEAVVQGLGNVRVGFA